MVIKLDGKHDGHHNYTDETNYETLYEPSNPMQPVIHTDNFQCFLEKKICLTSNLDPSCTSIRVNCGILCWYMAWGSIWYGVVYGWLHMAYDKVLTIYGRLTLSRFSFS